MLSNFKLQLRTVEAKKEKKDEKARNLQGQKNKIKKKNNHTEDYRR